MPTRPLNAAELAADTPVNRVAAAFRTDQPAAEADIAHIRRQYAAGRLSNRDVRRLEDVDFPFYEGAENE